MSGLVAASELGLPEKLARRPVLVLLVVCAICWLPGFFSLPPLDRDESRFAQASKQMIESGDYVDIRFSTVPRYNKPVGVYWLQAASTRLLGKPPYNQIWTYRIPSLLGAFVAVLLFYWLARALAPPPVSLIAAALLAASLLLVAEAKIATTDALLLAAIIAAQGLFLRAYLFARDRLAAPPGLPLALAGWAAIGIGLLLKGPVIIAVLAITAVALSVWDRDWNWLRWVRAWPGILVAAAVVIPWALAIAFASHGAFYERSLGHDFAAKLLAGQESHGAPPGYYFALASLTLWPVTLLALPAIGSAISERTEPAKRYLLAWLFPNWLMFELVPTKLPHYILPVYPAIVLLAALWALPPFEDAQTRRQRILRIAAAAQFLLATVFLGAAALLLPQRLGGAVSWWVAAAASIALLAGAVSAAAMLLRKRVTAIALGIVAAAGAYASLGIAAPSLGQLWLSPQMAAQIAANRKPDDPPVVLAGYVEPSLIFLLGTNTHIDNGERGGEVAASQGGLALVDDRVQRKFLNALSKRNAIANPVARISGLDYSRGRVARVTLFRVMPPRQVTAPPIE